MIDLRELTPEQLQVQHACPRCHRIAGRPYRVADDGTRQLRVLIRCGDCQHRWSALVEKDATK
jgi:hypothetical protein